jgi:hypothetical protein
MKKIITLCLALGVLSILPGAQAASSRAFAIPGYGRLRLQVPEAWKDELYRSANDRPPTVIITPAAGAPFRVHINVATFAPQVVQELDAGTLRRMAESAALNAAAQTAGESPALHEIDGEALHGFFFHVREKAPREGDFLFTTHGLARLENMVLVFSIHTQPGQEDVVRAALDMLRTMILEPEG